VIYAKESPQLFNEESAQISRPSEVKARHAGDRRHLSEFSAQIQKTLGFRHAPE
jgi:hypothetical protein